MKNKLTARELSSFCGQMGMLLHSGISTAEGLHILCDESKTDADRQILTPLIRSVEENGSLSRALDESGIFPTSMTAYVRTGEETGCLDEIMESLSSHYEQDEEISGQIRSAVTYPLLMLGMMAVVILVLLIKVLPVFQQVFNQMGMEMNGFPGTSECRQRDQPVFLCFSDPRRSPHWLHPVFQSYGKRSQPAAKNGHPSPVFP